MEMIKTEWKKIRTNKLLLVSFLVICAIPILYASFFLKSVWDPYGMTDQLPIAVVNEDQPVEFEGKRLSVGEDIEDTLKEDTNLDWHFVSAKEAQEGLENKEYYMIVTLPENFSANAATVMSDNPEKMEIQYETNGSLNYLGEVISEQAVKQLKGEVSEKVTKAYVTAVFNKLEEIGDGFTAGADGAAQLQDGISQASDGNKEIMENLNRLAASSLTFSDGSDTLSLGLEQYVSGVASAKEGADKLNQGLSQFTEGLAQYTEGVSNLNEGAGQLTQKSGELNTGASQVAEGASSANTAVTNLHAASSSLLGKLPAADTINGVKQMLNQETFYALPAEKQYEVLQTASQLLEGYTTVNSVVGQMDAGLEALSDKMPVLSSGAGALQQGIAAYTAGTSTLAEGLSQLDGKSPALVQANGQLFEGSSQLLSGLNLLSANSGSVVDGITGLSNGAKQISEGSTKLASGSAQLGDGLEELYTGTGDLAAGLNEGKEQLDSTNISDDVIDMVAAPDTLSQTKYSDVPNYGHALAPYVLSLALYVGCMVFNFIYPIRKVAIEGKSPVQWWLSKVSVGIVAATLMAIIESVVMLALGIETEHLGQYFGMIFITAYAYMFLIMVLSMAFDNTGRFVAMVLLILQLAGSGGTFPMQLTAKFFNLIHPFLPMTYSIMGLRQAISGGLKTSTYVSGFGVLLAVALASIALLLAVMTILQKHHKAGISQLDDNQKTMDTNYDYDKLIHE